MMTGCSKDVENIPEEVTEIPAAAPETDLQAVIEDVKVDVDDDLLSITNEDGQKLEVTSDLNESLEVPPSYPEDVLPLYSIDHIILAMDNGDQGYMISGLTDDAMDEVIEFYDKVLEKGEQLLTQTSDGLYMRMGSLEGYSYTLQVSPSDEGLRTSFTLIVVPKEE
jgi:hypothetical protein